MSTDVARSKAAPRPPRVLSRLASAAGRAPLLTLLLVLLAASVVFVALPGIDLAVTELFFVVGPDGVPEFPLKQSETLRSFKDISSVLPVVTALTAAAALFAIVLFPRRPPPMRPTVALFLLLVQLLGPGLLVNGVLKPAFERPRPFQVDLFGGTHGFVPAWDLGGDCESGCRSFVSGEASGAASLISLALLAPPVWRQPALAVVGLFTAAVSTNRLAFGDHFLSDVVLGSIMSVLITVALYQWLVAAPRLVDDATLLSGLRRIGLGARAGVAHLLRRLFKLSGFHGHRPAG